MLFSQLGEFPALNSLQLYFHEQEQHSWELLKKPSTHLLLQWAVLTALSRNTGVLSLTTLGLYNLLPIPHDSYASAGFSTLISRLTTLSVSIMHEGLGRYDHDKIVDFWLGPVMGILAAGTSLTSLALESDVITGRIPPLKWNQLPPCSPNLNSLVLNRFHITQDLEDFLVDSKATLQVLKFQYCRKTHGMAGPPTQSWGQLRRRLEQELTQLVEVRTGRERIYPS